MIFHRSILKLTFDPGGANTVLLNHGDRLLDGPVKFPQRNGLAVEPSPDSPYPLILSTLNSNFTMKFSKVEDGAASQAAAMAAALNSLISEAGRGVKQLKIEVLGWTAGKYWLVQFCGCGEHEPYALPVSGKNYTVKGYTLSCSGISYV